MKEAQRPMEGAIFLNTQATCTLYPGKEKRVYQAQTWIYRSEVAKADAAAQPGDVVRVSAANGTFLGQAFYNPRSQMTLRLLTRSEAPVDEAFIRSRIRRAIDYRRRFADLRSCRLIYSESDGLPGLVADAFGPVIVIQIMCLGMDRYRDTIVSALNEELRPEAVYERSDAPVRRLEGLEETAGLLSGALPADILMLENGIRFRVDVEHGQKTGYFLDQKENRAAIAPFVRGAETLDCFTHTGAFALHAAHYGAKRVTAVDISEEALETARGNAALNGFENIDFVCANAFDWLKAQSMTDTRYDVVILDPPAFTKTRATVDAARRGYKEINLRGLKLTRDGGYLVTCSCSQHMQRDEFVRVILEAARDAHVRLTQVELRSQGRDHPILPSMPETEYLKCGIFRVERI